MEKREHHSPFMRVKAGIVPMEITVKISQKTREKSTILFSIATVGINPNDSVSYYKDKCLSMPTATLFNKS